MFSITIILMIALLVVLSCYTHKLNKENKDVDLTENMPRYAMANRNAKLIYIKADSKSYLNYQINEFKNNKRFKDYGYEIDKVDWNGNIVHESRDSDLKLIKDRRK
ncbi:hypothetical protein UFVDC4_00152 [Staphylococcus phage vB_SauM-UFV_DC4]|nr:hypothetical protein UFVDC4_00152 [Staphylococcus phage vB_SauM-UFV_DC4]